METEPLLASVKISSASGHNDELNGFEPSTNNKFDNANRTNSFTKRDNNNHLQLPTSYQSTVTIESFKNQNNFKSTFSNASSQILPNKRPEPEWKLPSKDNKSSISDTSIIDWHFIFIITLLILISSFCYLFTREFFIYENPIHSWALLSVSVLFIWELSQLVETAILKLLSVTSGTRIWKIYFYAQSLRNSISPLITTCYLLLIRYSKTLTHFGFKWSPSLTDSFDSILRFTFLLCIFLIARQLITKHLTFLINQQRYTKAVQQLLFKGHVLERLCDPNAYQPIQRKPKSENVKLLYGNEKKQNLTNQETHPKDDECKSRIPLFVRRLSLAATQTEKKSVTGSEWHSPLYLLINRLREWDDAVADELPGGTGRNFFRSEVVAKKSAKRLFENVDRNQKGYLTIEDFEDFFPKKTAARAFKLFFTPAALKTGNANATTKKKKKADGTTKTADLPAPFKMITSADKNLITGENRKIAASTSQHKRLKKKLIENSETKTGSNYVVTNSDGSNPNSTIRDVTDELSGQLKVTIEIPSIDNAKPMANGISTSLDDEIEISQSPETNLCFGLTRSESSDALDTISSSNVDLSLLKLTPTGLESSVLRFHSSRETLTNQLREMDGLADVMQSLSQLIFWVCVCLLCFLVFDQHIQSLVFTLSTLFLSITFIFSETLRNMFRGIVLIFFIKPYNVGDRINIGQEKYRVVSIQLLTTTVKTLQNQIVILQNHNLANQNIINLSRSSNVIIKFEIIINFDTPSEKLARLRSIIHQHILDRPEEWKSQLSMHIASINLSTNTLNLSLLCSHLASYTQVKEWKKSKTELMETIRNALIELQISYKLPAQRILLENLENKTENTNDVEKILNEKINQSNLKNESSEVKVDSKLQIEKVSSAVDTNLENLTH